MCVIQYHSFAICGSRCFGLEGGDGVRASSRIIGPADDAAVLFGGSGKQLCFFIFLQAASVLLMIRRTLKPHRVVTSQVICLCRMPNQDGTVTTTSIGCLPEEHG